MFSFLGKSGSPKSTDKVWQTRNACMRGLVREAEGVIRESRTPVILFFFEDVRARFVEFLASKNVSFGLIGSGEGVVAAEQPGSLLIADVFGIGANDVTAWFTQQGKASSIVILFFGHYPLITQEDQALETLSQRVGNFPRVFHVSLDDPLFESFGADRLQGMMTALGIKEDECIEHAIVSKAIFNARKTLQNRVKQEIKIKTETGWFSANLPTT